MGYKLYFMYLTKEFTLPESTMTLMAEDNVVENDYIRLEIEPHTGYIKKLYDKVQDVNILSSSGAVPIVIDINHCDTWAHGYFEFRNELARFSDAKVKVIENGPVRAKIRVESSYNNSVLRQDFILYKNKPGVEVQVKLDWRERHKLLKLSFLVNIKEPRATYEIPYGFIERPTNGEEEPGQQWIDVTGKTDEKQYGMALLNDSKYSFDINESEMRMTVANGSIYADHFGNYVEKNRDELCEYMDQGIQEFKYALLPHAGDWRDSGIVRMANELNTPPIHVMETYHKGAMPQSLEGIKISVKNIIATVYKKAEDENGYILRCYESSGKQTAANIELPILNRSWQSEFSPCEIKTFFIPQEEQDAIKEVDFIELHKNQ
jgi:alpha-mannosidase